MPGEPLREYRVKLNNFDTVMRLSESDLANYPDAVPVDETEDAPTAKARTTTTTTNKARTATSTQNKAADGGGS